MNTATQITTTVIYHSADFDGIFCREIAKKFLGDGPEIQFIGWDFGDAPLAIPSEGQIIIMDLPVDRVFGLTNFAEKHFFSDAESELFRRTIWIDHHKSSIDGHPTDIPGYRIDGVSACRLAWQWFIGRDKMVQRQAIGLPPLPLKEEFTHRKVDEPLAVRLAGEYDIWDKRDPNAEVFQFGLRSKELTPYDWNQLLDMTVDDRTDGERFSTYAATALLENGRLLQRYQQQNDAGVVNFRSFMVEFEGLKFLALNTARCNSLTFAAKDIPETGHDALMGFFFDGKAWKFSLYHAKHNTGIDLSAIAVRFGGGGHRGACGFQIEGVNRICILNGKLDIH